MTRFASTLLLALTLALPRLGAAGEVARDRREIQGDQRELADDVRDARQMEALLAAWERARTAPHPRELVEVELRVTDALNHEDREAKREASKAKGELNRSRREVREERRELAKDANQNRPARFGDDARDLRDDRRDRADDKADLEREQRFRRRIHELRIQWQSLVGRTHPAAMGAKRRVLQELVQLARAEIAADNQELREDHAERREDRVERREEHRERFHH